MSEFAYTETTLKEMGTPILFAKLDGDFQRQWKST